MNPAHTRRKPNPALLIGVAVAGGVIFLMVLAGVVLLLLVRSPSASAASLPQTSNARLNGLTVDDYGPMLLDGNMAVSNEGLTALGQMGPEALRWFLKGMDSGYPHVRRSCLDFLPVETAMPYRSAFEPTLLRLLDSSDVEDVPRAAAKLVALKSDRGTARVREKADDPQTPPKTRARLQTLLSR